MKNGLKQKYLKITKLFLWLITGEPCAWYIAGLRCNRRTIFSQYVFLFPSLFTSLFLSLYCLKNNLENESVHIYDPGPLFCLDIRKWIRNIEHHAPNNVNKVLMGNKVDLDESKMVIDETFSTFILESAPSEA